MRHLTAIILMAAMTCLMGCADEAAQLTPATDVDTTNHNSDSPTKPVKKKMKAPSAQGGPVIGEPAPEIVGVDLEGVEFKLSDYQGKVVMLDFYGDW